LALVALSGRHALGAAQLADAGLAARDLLECRTGSGAVAGGAHHRHAVRATRRAARNGRTGVDAADATRAVADPATRRAVGDARDFRCVRLRVHERRTHPDFADDVTRFAFAGTARVAANAVDAIAGRALLVGFASAASRDE
jgi:hypothetical protein